MIKSGHHPPVSLCRNKGTGFAPPLQCPPYDRLSNQSETRLSRSGFFFFECDEKQNEFHGESGLAVSGSFFDSQALMSSQVM